MGTSVTDPNISVYFAQDGETVGEYTSKGASPCEITQFQAVYDAIAAVTNLNFTITQDANADFLVAIDDDELLGSLDGKMGPPGEENEGEAIFDGHDIVRGPGGALDAGGYDFMVVVHETLHGLGLSHPHDNGGGSPIMDGVDDAFGDYGSFNLNQGVFTAMTYNNGYFTGTDGSQPDDNLIFGYEMGPMALDIAVLQAAYGANTTTATGDNIYALPDQNDSGTGWTSIWDAGGEDTLLYEGTSDVVLDLRAATLQYEEGGGGFVSAAYGIAGGYTIANGVVIENASAGAGDDTLTGNDAANTLTAADGADTLSGGAGDDTLNGGAGDDLMNGGAGSDSFASMPGDGDDVIEDFDPFMDVLVFDGFDTSQSQGNPSNIQEFLAANAEVDGTDLTITLGAGHSVRLIDVINEEDPEGSIATIAEAITGLEFEDQGTPSEEPTEGDDLLFGTDGDDRIDALGGNDTVNGAGGEDTLLGSDGDDVLNGGDDNDELIGKNGADTLDGGFGNDEVHGGSDDDLVNGGQGNDRMSGGKGNDVLNGGAGRDNVAGDAGDDTLFGDDGNDTLKGDAGNDVLNGGAGRDRILGGKDDDEANGGTGNDKLYGNDGNDLLRGDAGNDKAYGGIGDDSLEGGSGNDQLFGEDGHDELNGDDGNDKLYGADGDDMLIGGNGNDLLVGGAGADTLIGGAGNDAMAGGDDADLFVIGGEEGHDKIFDFAYGEDLINLTEVQFGTEPDQMSRADFLSENASIDGSDLYLDLGDGRSIRILDVVDEEEIGEDVEDYEDVFAFM